MAPTMPHSLVLRLGQRHLLKMMQLPTRQVCCVILGRPQLMKNSEIGLGVRPAPAQIMLIEYRVQRTYDPKPELADDGEGERFNFIDAAGQRMHLGCSALRMVTAYILDNGDNPRYPRVLVGHAGCSKCHRGTHSIQPGMVEALNSYAKVRRCRVIISD